MKIRLIVKPGLFLYFVGITPNGSAHFSTLKDDSQQFDNRDEAIDVIKKLNDISRYYYNFEIINY